MYWIPVAACRGRCNVQTVIRVQNKNYGEMELLKKLNNHLLYLFATVLKGQVKATYDPLKLNCLERARKLGNMMHIIALWAQMK